MFLSSRSVSLGRTAAALTASSLVVLAGCGSTSGTASPGRATSSSVSAPTSNLPTNPTTPPGSPSGSTAPSAPVRVSPSPGDSPPPTITASQTSTPESTQAATITEIRTAAQNGFDRVVIDVSGPLPGYQVSYVDSLFFDGSGAPVTLKGKAFLRVRLAPATANGLMSGKEYLPGLQTLNGYTKTGDFEAVVSFGLGLSHRAGFHVFTLTGPSRIVIDIAH